ncbi:MAG: hypothetical protein ACQEP7_00450 [bacterium]
MAYLVFIFLLIVFIVLTVRLLEPEFSSFSKNDRDSASADWPVVARFNSREMAHLAASILKKEDLKIIVDKNWATGLYNRIRFGENKILVSPDDLREAVEILSETKFNKNLEK